MLGLLKSAAGLVADVAQVVVAPVEVALDLAGAVVKPVADVAEDLAKEVKELTK